MEISENSEKSLESRVSAVLEAQACVKTIAGAEPGDTVMRQLARASRRIPFWRWSRVKDAWYADGRMRVGADELARLREIELKYSGKKANADAAPTATAERQELDVAAILARLERIEAALRLSDPDAYRALVGEGGASRD